MIIGTYQRMIVYYTDDTQQLFTEDILSVEEEILKSFLLGIEDKAKYRMIKRYNWGHFKGCPIRNVRVQFQELDKENKEAIFEVEIRLNVDEQVGWALDLDDWWNWLRKLMTSSCPYPCQVSLAENDYYLGD